MPIVNAAAEFHYEERQSALEAAQRQRETQRRREVEQEREAKRQEELARERDRRAEIKRDLLDSTDRVLMGKATKQDINHIVNHKELWSNLLINRYKKTPRFLEDKTLLFPYELQSSLNRVLLVLNKKYGQHIYDVDNQIAKLERESSYALWPGTKKDKIGALMEIKRFLEEETIQPLTISDVKTKYPLATRGFFSQRTNTLLDDIQVSVSPTLNRGK